MLKSIEKKESAVNKKINKKAFFWKK